MDKTILPLKDVALFKQKALHWANQFEIFILLDSNTNSSDKYGELNWVLAIDAIDFCMPQNNYFETLRTFQQTQNSPIFGFISYSIYQTLFQLKSFKKDEIGFPDFYFFKPRYIVEIIGDKISINRNYPETFEILEAIQNFNIPAPIISSIELENTTSKEQYLQNVNSIKNKILDGDFYEMNYCVELKSEVEKFDFLDTFFKMNARAEAPFSTFVKYNTSFLLCTSPERFLKKINHKIISQPIKGTRKKGQNLQEENDLLIDLKNDPKEQAENVMIVDLVRNDLAQTAKVGSVKVEELFGVYPFKTVNHLISTVTAEMNETTDFSTVLQQAFPMGSMTGAPKKEVLKNIDLYENFARGLYSGSVGYINENTDFDFNVVIRALFYNQNNKTLSLRIGSAITFDADPEKEYEELLTKAQSILSVLKGS